MTTKQQLKNYFKQGAIPTGQHFAEFIDAFVAYVNGNTPNTDGNIDIGYQLIEKKRADALCSNYPEGVSEFVSDYDKANYTQYIAENPSFGQLENGRIVVRTFKYSNPRVCYQQIDNIADGVFKASFYRSEQLNGEWGELIKVDYLGDVKTDNETIIINNGKISLHPEVVQNVDNSFLRLTSNLLVHTEKIASTTEPGHVRVDGTTIVLNDGVISIKQGLLGIVQKKLYEDTFIAADSNNVTFSTDYSSSDYYYYELDGSRLTEGVDYEYSEALQKMTLLQGAIPVQRVLRVYRDEIHFS